MIKVDHFPNVGFVCRSIFIYRQFFADAPCNLLFLISGHPVSLSRPRHQPRLDREERREVQAGRQASAGPAGTFRRLAKGWCRVAIALFFSCFLSLSFVPIIYIYYIYVAIYVTGIRTGQFGICGSAVSFEK